EAPRRWQHRGHDIVPMKGETRAGVYEGLPAKRRTKSGEIRVYVEAPRLRHPQRHIESGPHRHLESDVDLYAVRNDLVQLLVGEDYRLSVIDEILKVGVVGSVLRQVWLLDS